MCAICMHGIVRIHIFPCAGIGWLAMAAEATTDKTTTLVVAQAGPLRDSLQSFLQMLPQSVDVLLADSAEMASWIIGRHHPLLVVVANAGLPSEEAVLRVMQRTRAAGPRSRWLFLMERPEQEQAALAAGADMVLPQGFPASTLFGIVELMLAGAGQREG